MTPLSDTKKDEVIARLKTCMDPELPTNIYDLGLVYGIEISPAGVVRIAMTLTSPFCPLADTFPDMVAESVRVLPWVADVAVALVWEPPWESGRMSEVAKLQCGML